MEFTNSTEARFNLLKTGVPVQFDWSQAGVTNTWFGYVSSVTKSATAQLTNVTEVHCIGTSFILKDRATRVFVNTSIPMVVKNIVTSYGFNFIGIDNQLKFDHLSMAGHSYWEWIQEQATRIGYGVAVRGMDFIFKPLDKMIDQSMTNVPVLSLFGEHIPTNTMFLDRTLDSFKVISGEHIESGSSLRTNKSVNGVDPVTNQVFKSTSSPNKVGVNVRATQSDVLFSEVRNEQVVNSFTAAQTLSEGAAHNGRLNMPARVKCQGDPNIQPFSAVYVEGTGSTTDGYWVCKEVKHLFAFVGDYQIEMIVSSDGLGPNAVSTRRQGTDSIVGVVNLIDALANNGINSAALTSKEVKLAIKSSIHKESNQGFKRTPALWVHSASKAR
jgi:phage protein D